MVKKLFHLAISLILLLTPTFMLGQTAPALGTASSFALFTAVGAFNNVGGGTTVTGDVGTNVGAFNAFPPGTLIGSIHVADATSAQAAIDVNTAYSYLSGVTCGQVLGVSLGGGQVLTPNVYCIGAAATLTGSLVLDGQGNPNSIFIIKINGALSAAASSSVVLINGASLCNVYWQINGQFTLGTNAIFNGTALVNGAIDFSAGGASLFGRALSISGAISLKNNVVTIGLPPVASTITASGSTTFCAGGNVVLSGNVGGTWSSGGSTSSKTITTSGNYYVTNTTGCGSITSNTISVTVLPNPTITVNSATICAGSSATLTASSATTFSWAPSTALNATTGSSVIASPTTTTIYTVTGTTSGCSATKNSTVTVNPVPTATISASGPLTFCQGGSVNLTASNGSSYLWSTSATTKSITVTTSGNYSVTITGANGCSATSSITTVVVNPLPTVTVNSGVICSGSSATLTANGANTYSWSPGTGLSATTGSNVIANPTVTTTYTINGTSAAGCVNTTTASVTVVPSLTLTINSASICIGSSATLTANGANTYSWSPGTTLNSTTGSSVIANPTVTTVYTVTGTAGSCTATQTSTVTINPLPTATISAGGPLTFCQGGSVILTASAGTTYSWSTGATTQSISVTAAGNYSVTVTNANGCSATSSVTTVMVNPLPIITVNNEVMCPSGSATLIASGANTYSWSPGTGLSSTTGATVIASPTITSTYTITGTSLDGCVNTTTASVTVFPNLILTVNSAIICLGSPTTLTVTGANTYSWSPGTGLNATTGSTVIANPTVTTVYTVTGTSGACSGTQTAVVMVNSLPTITVNSGSICAGDSIMLNASGANTYTWVPGTGLSSTTGASVTANPTVSTTYTITGDNGVTAPGCVNTTTALVTVLPNPTITVNSATICAGSSATLTASGATTFSWAPSTALNATTGSSVIANPTTTTIYMVTGTTGSCSATKNSTVTVNPVPTATISASGPLTFCQGDSVKLTASNGSSYLWSTSATTQSISVTTSGNYSVTITDANGCSATSSITTVVVNPLPTVTVNNGVICSGSSATLTANGANTYSWSPGTGLSATTGSNVIANPTVTTTYTITGTSSLGCVNTTTASVTVVPSLTLTINSASICIGSSATLTANGANTYSWSPGTALNSITGSSVIANPTVTTVYTVTGTAGSCTATQTSTVTVNPLPTATISAGGPLTFCQGDSVKLTASAGTTYSWSTGATTQSISVTAAGNYSVSVTNASGCSATSSVTTVMVNPSPTITANSGVICSGNSATLIASGANTYSWSPGTGLSSTTGATVIASPTVTTTYTITGTSVAGCVNTTTASVTIASNLTLTVNSATICAGSSTILTANGANTYSWSPGSGLNATTGSSVIANPTVTTIYIVNGIAGSCSATQIATVTVIPAPTASIAAGGPLNFCQGGSVILTANSGLSYLWSTGATTQSISVSSSGNYSVTVTNVNGCSATSSVTTVMVNPPPTATIAASGSTTICQGDYVILTSSAGSSYLWSNSATTQSIIVSSAGNYSVTVTDANGCSATSSVTSVFVNFLPTASVAVNGPTVFCQGGSTTLTASGGVSYLWSNNATTQSITVTTGGNYSVTVTSINGCTATSAAITISVNPSPTVNLGADTTVCGCILLNAYNPGASYSWNTGSDYSMINVCLSGTYWVNVSNGICITTDTIHVVAYSIPLVNISIASGTVSILNAGNPGASYLWNTGATTQTIVADTAGKYYVTVTNQFGCSGSDTLLLGIVGINEVINSKEPLKIYPNPNNGIFTIDLQNDMQVEISNILGEKITDEFLIKGQNRISLEDQPNGIYFVKIRSGSRQEVIKIIKEN